MASLLGLRFSPRVVLLGVVFAALATTAFIAFRGLYRAMFSLLMGWVVVFVLVARAVLGGDDELEDEDPPGRGPAIAAGEAGGEDRPPEGPDAAPGDGTRDGDSQT